MTERTVRVVQTGGLVRHEDGTIEYRDLFSCGHSLPEKLLPPRQIGDTAVCKKWHR